jgi:hypothetical protein
MAKKKRKKSSKKTGKARKSTTKKRRKTSKKRAKKTSYSSGYSALEKYRKGVETITAAKIKARAKTWKCRGRVKTGCGGGGRVVK